MKKEARSQKSEEKKLTPDEIAQVREWIAWAYRKKAEKDQPALKREKTEVRSQKTEEDQKIEVKGRNNKADQTPDEKIKALQGLNATLKAQSARDDATLRALRDENMGLLNLKTRNQELQTQLANELRLRKNAEEGCERLMEQRAQNDLLIADLQKQLAAKPEKHHRADIKRIRELEEVVRSQESEVENNAAHVSELHGEITRLSQQCDHRIRESISEINKQQNLIANLKSENKMLQHERDAIRASRDEQWQQAHHFDQLMDIAITLDTALAGILRGNPSLNNPHTEHARQRFAALAAQINGAEALKREAKQPATTKET